MNTSAADMKNFRNYQPEIKRKLIEEYSELVDDKIEIINLDKVRR